MLWGLTSKAEEETFCPRPVICRVCAQVHKRSNQAGKAWEPGKALWG